MSNGDDAIASALGLSGLGSLFQGAAHQQASIAQQNALMAIHQQAGIAQQNALMGMGMAFNAAVPQFDAAEVNRRYAELQQQRWLAETSPHWREVMLDIELGIWEPPL